MFTRHVSIGSSLLIAALCVSRTLFGDYGDCTNYTAESNVSCVNPIDCGGPVSTQCLPTSGWNVGNVPPGANYVVVTQSMKAGVCQNTYWDYGCAWCSKLVCGQVAYYGDVDPYGQCTDLLGAWTLSCNGCCGA